MILVLFITFFKYMLSFSKLRDSRFFLFIKYINGIFFFPFFSILKENYHHFSISRISVQKSIDKNQGTKKINLNINSRMTQAQKSQRKLTQENLVWKSEVQFHWKFLFILVILVIQIYICMYIQKILYFNFYFPLK